MPTGFLLEVEEEWSHGEGERAQTNVQRRIAHGIDPSAARSKLFVDAGAARAADGPLVPAAAGGAHTLDGDVHVRAAAWEGVRTLGVGRTGYAFSGREVAGLPRRPVRRLRARLA